MSTSNDSTFVGGGFADRQKALFASLDEADKLRNDGLRERAESGSGSCYDEEKHDFPSRRKRHNTKKFQGKDSIFKRPEIPLHKVRRFNAMPDFKRNPHKWTKYSLADVEEMTDKSNTAAAMAFLQEIQQRREAEAAPMEVSDESTVKFKSKTNIIQDSIGNKRVVSQSQSSTEGEKPKYQNSKLIMPEYVFGKKRVEKKKRIQPSAECSSSAKIKLDHLMDDDSLSD